jgi:hypothetical protein
MPELQAPWASALLSAVSACAAWFAFSVNRRSLTAKFMDRLFELDKLILAHPKSFGVFMHAQGWDDAAFGDASARCDEYYRAKAFTYFYLNLFEEIHAALDGPRLWPSAQWQAWRAYIHSRVRHPLVTATIEAQCLLADDGGRLRLRPRSDEPALSRRFLVFLADTQAAWWRQPFDPQQF